MKLIIEIPDEKYEWIKKNNPNPDNNSIVGYIANGTPITEGDMISRSALKAETKNLMGYIGSGMSPTMLIRNQVIDLIDNAPTVEERPQGEWIADTSHRYSDDEDTFECSICKEPFTLISGTPKDNLYNFCPKCGARLIKEDQYDRGDNK